MTSSMNDVLIDAPFDLEEGFTLTDRWYCKETSTYYPVGTTRWEIERELDDGAGNQGEHRHDG